MASGVYINVSEKTKYIHFNPVICNQWGFSGMALSFHEKNNGV